MKAAKLRYRTSGYVSDFEQYLGNYLHEHPEVEADQRRGWFLWWDRRVDPADVTPRQQYAVKVKGYQYE